MACFYHAEPGESSANLIAGLLNVVKLLVRPLFYEAKMGAYMNLWAGLSLEVKGEDGGMKGFLIPSNILRMDSILE